MSEYWFKFGWWKLRQNRPSIIGPLSVWINLEPYNSHLPMWCVRLYEFNVFSFDFGIVSHVLALKVTTVIIGQLSSLFGWIWLLVPRLRILTTSGLGHQKKMAVKGNYEYYEKAFDLFDGTKIQNHPHIWKVPHEPIWIFKMIWI